MILSGLLALGQGWVSLKVKKSRSGNHNNFSRNSTASFELVVFSNTRLLKNRLARVSFNPKLARYNADGGWKSLKCRRTRHVQKRVLSVQSGVNWFSLRGSGLGYGCSFPTRHRHSFFPFSFQQFWDGFNGWKPDSFHERQIISIFPSPPTTPV